MLSFVLGLSALAFTTTLVAPEPLHAAAQVQPLNVTTVKKTGRTQFFAKKPWQGLFSAKKFTNRDRFELLNIKQTLQASLVELPTKHTAALKKLEVRKQDHVSRGLANSRMIILNTESVSSNIELQAVFVHELGHVVDLGALKSKGWQKSRFWTPGTKVFVGDPSIRFYELSWVNSKQRKTNVRRTDFVSGYAMTSPFEDFAESYLFYRLHGEKFRQIATESKILQVKYDFMKTQVFENQEFQTEKQSAGFLHNLIWDATLVSF